MILLHSLCDWLAEQVSLFFNFLNFFSGERSDREERSQSDREERGKRASGGGSVIFFSGSSPCVRLVFVSIRLKNEKYYACYLGDRVIG